MYISYIVANLAGDFCHLDKIIWKLRKREKKRVQIRKKEYILNYTILSEVANFTCFQYYMDSD